MSTQLDKVLTVPEVAAITGWHRRRMLRHLLNLNSRVGGTLLHNIGSKEKPRWTVTLKALRSVAPAWFSDAETIESRVAFLEGEVRQIRRQLTRTNDVVSLLHV